MTAHSFTALHGTGGVVTGPALMSSKPFSARYDLDRRIGVISRKGHPLRGMSIKGHILVTRSVEGGVAAGWALLAMARLQIGFAGLVFNETNPAMVQGAVLAGIPIVAGLPQEVFETFDTGQLLTLEGTLKQLTVVSAVVGAPATSDGSQNY